MVQTLAIDEDNDIFLNPLGNISLVTGILAIEDACKNVSLAQLGEEVLTTTQGLPTMQTIFNGSPKIGIYEAYLRTALESVPGVVAVTALTYSVIDGVFAYQANIETIYGSLFVNG